MRMDIFCHVGQPFLNPTELRHAHRRVELLSRHHLVVDPGEFIVEAAIRSFNHLDALPLGGVQLIAPLVSESTALGVQWRPHVHTQRSVKTGLRVFL